MRSMLDTNTASDLILNPWGRVASRIAEIGESEVCISIIVAAELRYGAAKKGSSILTNRVNDLLDRLDVLPFEPPADALYGMIRARLQSAGRPIGSNDLLIAAHAMALGNVLVTNNVAEFARVEGLKYENWLSPPSEMQES